MEFRFDAALPVLRRTPQTVTILLQDLSPSWTNATEGPGTWSPFDVVGHLIHGERTDWIPRVEHVLRHGDAIPFPLFDREAMFEASQGHVLSELLRTFADLRAASLSQLEALSLTEADLERCGRHPEFGLVTLRQHLSTWVAHDLGHIAQIVRVMARQYQDAVGPWRTYLSVLRNSSSLRPQLITSSATDEELSGTTVVIDDSRRIRGRALGALIIAGILIGCSPILVRLSHVGPVATSFWRLCLALVPVSLVFARARATAPAARTLAMPATAAEQLAAAVPGIFLASDLATWQISLHMTSVANATLLVNMAPIFVTLGGWLLFREPVTRYFLVGLAVSSAGVIVLKGGVAAWGEGNVRGDLLALGASVFYAGYLLALGRARERFSTGVVMLWSTVAAAIFTLPLALLWDDSVWPATLGAWAVLLALGWVTHAGGQGLVAYALAWLPTTFSSLTLLIQPVVAAILAWMFLAEPLTAFQIAGGVIVIAGIIVAKRG